jgi:hypothetical protein
LLVVIATSPDGSSSTVVLRSEPSGRRSTMLPACTQVALARANSAQSRTVGPSVVSACPS